MNRVKPDKEPEILFLPKTNETLPQALLRLALLYQKIKPLGFDTEINKRIMTNPELLPQYINQANGDDTPV
ncbi:MAG: hypothetical protein HC785_04280 [Calothrix sp. CSU_2_0]|nr:hypothetical protein [Calothrix sp. CSU_2_0]